MPEITAKKSNEKGEPMENLIKVYEEDVDSTDIDLYVFSGFKLNAVKDWGVDLPRLKNHIKKANNDNNSKVIIGGPVSALPVGLLDLEYVQVTLNNILKTVTDEEKLKSEMEKFLALPKEERDDYFLNSDDVFKFYFIVHSGNFGFDKDFEPSKPTKSGKDDEEEDEEKEFPRDEKGQIKINSTEMKSYASKVKQILKEHYFDPYIAQMKEMFADTVAKNKLIGGVGGNEEFKARNIGYQDMLEEFFKAVGKPELYLNNGYRYSQFNFKFKQFLQDNHEQVVSVLYAPGVFSGRDLKGIKNKLFNVIGRQHPDVDFVISSGFNEFVMIPKAREMFDEIHKVAYVKYQFYINIPGYQTIGNINKVFNNSFELKNTMNHKLKIGVCRNPLYYKFPELLDENGNVIDIYSKTYQSSLKNPEEISNLDRKEYVFYDAPYIPFCNVLELGNAINQSSSPLLRNLYLRNAPKSQELKAEIVNMKRVIDQFPYLIEQLGTKPYEDLAKEVEQFDYSNPSDIMKLYHDIHSEFEEGLIKEKK